jgi:hypothetical protein
MIDFHFLITRNFRLANRRSSSVRWFISFSTSSTLSYVKKKQIPCTSFSSRNIKSHLLAYVDYNQVYISLEYLQDILLVLLGDHFVDELPIVIHVHYQLILVRNDVGHGRMIDDVNHQPFLSNIYRIKSFYSRRVSILTSIFFAMWMRTMAYYIQTWWRR